MKEFPEGCVVKLRSGGPDMVVEDILGTGSKVCCVWFAGELVQRDEFYPDALHWVAKGQE